MVANWVINAFEGAKWVSEVHRIRKKHFWGVPGRISGRISWNVNQVFHDFRSEIHPQTLQKRDFRILWTSETHFAPSDAIVTHFAPFLSFCENRDFSKFSKSGFSLENADMSLVLEIVISTIEDGSMVQKTIAWVPFGVWVSISIHQSRHAIIWDTHPVETQNVLKMRIFANRWYQNIPR